MSAWLEKHWTRTVACFVAGVVVVALLLARPYTRYRGGETDQVSYMLQAKILATGRNWVPSPPEEVRSFFLTRHCVSDGRFFSYYWPLTSFVYALPLLLGVTWYLAQALAYGAAGLFAYLALRGTSGGVLAGAFAQLGAYGVLAERAWTANSEVLAVMAVMLAFWLARRAFAQWRPGWSAASGLACSLVILSRPLTGTVVGFSIGVAFLVATIRRLGRWPALVSFGVCALVGVVALMAYGHAITGSPLTPPSYVYAPESKLFFGMRGFQDPIEYFGITDALGNLRILVGHWWFLLAACAAGGMVLWRRSLAADPVVPAALGAGLLLGALYCCFFGFKMSVPRYCVDIGAPLVLFYAWLAAHLARRATDDATQFPAGRAASAAFVLFFVALAVVSLALQGATSYQRTKRFDRTLADLDGLVGSGPALVVLKRPEDQNPSERNWRLGCGPVTYLINDPWMRSPRLYAVEREGKTDDLFEYYKGSRRVYLVSVDERTGEVSDLTPPHWRTAPHPNARE